MSIEKLTQYNYIVIGMVAWLRSSFHKQMVSGFSPTVWYFKYFSLQLLANQCHVRELGWRKLQKDLCVCVCLHTQMCISNYIFHICPLMLSFLYTLWLITLHFWRTIDSRNLLLENRLKEHPVVKIIVPHIKSHSKTILTGTNTVLHRIYSSELYKLRNCLVLLLTTVVSC